MIVWIKAIHERQYHILLRKRPDVCRQIRANLDYAQVP